MPSPREFWGYLISRDHPTQPTPLFRRLLGAIADYVVKNIAPRDVRCLTPVKLAGFYRAVGGDLDELFLATSATKLSDIYSTLGCAHSLQPVPGDDFLPPSIPALSERGFAIWQTIQLLLDPEEHVHYLQNAVKQFALRDPETGEPFPREIPKEAFPRRPDVETERWHDEAFERKKKREAEEKAKREAEEKLGAAAAAAAAAAPSTTTVVESEGEDWGYRPRRKHRHRRQTSYDEPPAEGFSSSAAGSGHEQYGRPSHRHGGHRHSHKHTYPSPAADVYGAPVVVETPVGSDLDDEELYAAPRQSRYSQSHPRSSHHHHHHHHHPRQAHSKSRSRGASHEYLRASYVYTNPEPAHIDPYAHIPVDPPATYIRPSESHLHGYHSTQNLHYLSSPTPQLVDDDLRNRFLRHRSSSPATRAPLGNGSRGHSHSRSHMYVESEYEAAPLPADPYYEDEDVAAMREADFGIEQGGRRRKKEARSTVEKEHDRRRRRREVKEQAYAEAQRSEMWGGNYHSGSSRKSAGVYYP